MSSLFVYAIMNVVFWAQSAHICLYKCVTCINIGSWAGGSMLDSNHERACQWRCYHQSHTHIPSLPWAHFASVRFPFQSVSELHSAVTSLSSKTAKLLHIFRTSLNVFNKMAICILMFPQTVHTYTQSLSGICAVMIIHYARFHLIRNRQSTTARWLATVKDVDSGVFYRWVFQSSGVCCCKIEHRRLRLESNHSMHEKISSWFLVHAGAHTHMTCSA